MTKFKSNKSELLNSKSRTSHLAPRIPIITIQGPTAVGKSSLALKIADELNTEIISVDSRQVYKFLDIGTSKPTKAEQSLIKHHLIDIVFPNEEYNAGMFIKDAKSIITGLYEKKKIPLIVGGTGFYIKSLLDGLVEIPDIPKSIRNKFEKIAEKKGADFIHDHLKKIDPRAARRIEKNDVQKMLRAIEVWEFTGKPISQFWKEQKNGKKYKTFNILLTEKRENLYQKIEKRVDEMMKKGLLEEVRNLLKMGYKVTDPGMITVGYREFYPYLKKEKNLDECVALMKQNTRNYAKRQLTWYRKIDFDLTLPAIDIKFYDIIKLIKDFWKCQELK